MTVFCEFVGGTCSVVDDVVDDVVNNPDKTKVGGSSSKFIKKISSNNLQDMKIL